jgi:hypothetical protein
MGPGRLEQQPSIILKPSVLTSHISESVVVIRCLLAGDGVTPWNDIDDYTIVPHSLGRDRGLSNSEGRLTVPDRSCWTAVRSKTKRPYFIQYGERGFYGLCAVILYSTVLKQCRSCELVIETVYDCTYRSGHCRLRP